MAGGTNEISRSRSVLSVSRALKQLVAASKGGGTCGGRIEGRWRWKMESRREGKGRKIRLETFLGFISAIRDGFPPETQEYKRYSAKFLSLSFLPFEISRAFPRAGRWHDRTESIEERLFPERRNNNEISFSLSREHEFGTN